MQGFVRKGLLLSVATGALVLGGGAAAQADTAVANGSASGSPGAGSGNVAQVAGENPVNVCGDTGGVGAAADPATADQCVAAGNSAVITGAAQDSPGAVAGNVAGAALDAPAQACGDTAHVLSTGSGANGDSCITTGTSAAVTGSATGSAGAGSGNVIQLAENAPVNVCGNSVGVGSFDSPAIGDACLNTGTPGAPAPVLSPPPVISPPPILPPVQPPTVPPVCGGPTPPVVTVPVPPVVTPPVPPVVTPPVVTPPVITPPVVPVLPPPPVAAPPVLCAQPAAATPGFARPLDGAVPLLGGLSRL